MITQEYVTPLFNLFVVPPEFKPGTDLFPRYAFPHHNAGTDQAVKVTEINVTEGCLSEGFLMSQWGWACIQVAQEL